MNKKLLLISFLFLLLSLSFVYGTGEIIYSFTSANNYGGNEDRLLAQTFTTNSNVNIGNFSLNLGRLGSPGTVTAGIQSLSGGVPDGAYLCSDTYDGNLLPLTLSSYTNNDWVSFDCDITLSSSTVYAIVFTSATRNAANQITWSINTGGGFSGGSAYKKDGAAAWGVWSTFDGLFMIANGTGIAGTSFYSVNVLDYWDGTAVNGVNISLNGSVYQNATGNIIYTDVVNTGGLWNITINGTNHFSNNLVNHNLTLNNSLHLKNSHIQFTAEEILTNNDISPYNITIDGNTNQAAWYLKAGTYTVQLSKSNYYNKNYSIIISNLQNDTLNLSYNYQSIINLSAFSVQTGLIISNITGWIYHNATATNISLSNLTGTFITMKALYDPYSIYLIGKDYATGVTNYKNVIPGAATINYLFGLFTKNNINFTFINSETLLPVNNVTLEYFSLTDSGTESTDNSTIFLSLLQPEDYTFRYNSTGFKTNLYFFTVVDGTYNELTLYLTPSNITTAITVEVIDGAASPLENAKVYALKHFVNDNTYKTVSTGVTNPDGETILDLITANEFYKFVIVYNGETVKTTSPFIITGTTVKIQVILGSETLTDYYNQIGISSNLVFNPLTNNFRQEFTDPNSVNRHVCLYTYKQGMNIDTLINTTCVTGSSGTILHPIIALNGSSFYSKSYVTINNIDYLLDQESISFNPNSFGSVGLFGQILLSIIFSMAGFLAIELIFITLPLSIIIGGMVGLHSISLGYTTPLLIVGIIIMLMLRRNN